MSVRVIWVTFDDLVEIFDRFFMVAYHLVTFCSFMNVSNIVGRRLDALAEREYGLLELLRRIRH